MQVRIDVIHARDCDRVILVTPEPLDGRFDDGRSNLCCGDSSESLTRMLAAMFLDDVQVPSFDCGKVCHVRQCSSSLLQTLKHEFSILAFAIFLLERLGWDWYLYVTALKIIVMFVPI